MRRSSVWEGQQPLLDGKYGSMEISSPKVQQIIWEEAKNTMMPFPE